MYIIAHLLTIFVSTFRTFLPKFIEMSVNYSLGQSFLILFCGLLCAVGMAFLANFLLSGPKLGFHYDFLQSRKIPSPVSEEILIIDTGEYIETSDIFSVLITLTEMDASNLILTGKMSPSSSPITITEAEIRRRFVDEYFILGTNIRNLFEAIRSGSVSPVQAPGYVDRLVELADQGRDRLLTAIINRDEDLLRSIIVFSSFISADAKPVFDWDGKIRRVQPVDFEILLEHSVYTSLKHRYVDSQIETDDQGKILWLKKINGEEINIPLDRNGNIITPLNSGFRRIDVSLFREYDEAGRAMRTALSQANELGAFSQTLPEKSPFITGDYALMLREEMLKRPDSEKKSAWIIARNNYFKSLDEFLNGQAEMVLVNGYNNVIQDEKTLDEKGLSVLAGMRDDLRNSFTLMRHEYNRLVSIHDKLQEELALSYCIMGTEGYAQYSALLANVMITNSYIKPAYDRGILFWSIIAATVVLLLIFMFQPVTQLICGVCLSVIASAVFGCIFVFYSYWIDPVVVLSSSLLGTFVIFYLKCAGLKYRARRFRAAYGTAVSKDVLKELIILGHPRLSETDVSLAAVIAVKDFNLFNEEDHEDTDSAWKKRIDFLTSVKDAVFASGAVIAGFEGDTVLVCFGSPLDKSYEPPKKACAFVKKMLNDDKIKWRFGIDFGKCTFQWSAETGYSVYGKPAVHARKLVLKTAKLKSRALISEEVQKNISVVLNRADSSNEKSIYELN
jgi:hypothetical protein